MCRQLLLASLHFFVIVKHYLSLSSSNACIGVSHFNLDYARLKHHTFDGKKFSLRLWLAFSTKDKRVFVFGVFNKKINRVFVGVIQH